MTRTFTIEATYDDGWWVLVCDDPGAVSQCRRLDQVEDEMREALAYLAKIPEDEVRMNVVPILPKEYMQEVNTIRATRQEEQLIHARSKEQTTRGVKHLAALGLRTRDIGSLLGITHQRASQLIHA